MFNVALLCVELRWVPISWVVYDLVLVLELSSFSDVLNYLLGGLVLCFVALLLNLNETTCSYLHV
jgi:hypothetical protein